MVDVGARVAVITGAAGGIGSAVTRMFLDQQYVVVAVDLDEETLNLLPGCSDGSVIAVAADVSTSDAWMELAEVIDTGPGRVDVLFNNAGIEGVVSPLEAYSLSKFDQVMAVSVRGTFLGMQTMLPRMYERGTGAIVNCSSVSGLRGAHGFAAYVAAKHAVIGLTRVAAIEAASRGVRVNAVCPGPIDTRMMASIIDSEGSKSDVDAREQTLMRNPMGRWGTADEVAEVVGFLADPSRATYVNGAILSVDGGRTAL